MGHFSVIPPAAISRVLATFDRKQLEGFVAVAIDLMDLADGDPDQEDATDAEDEGFSRLGESIAQDDGPGCPIADPDACVDDRGEFVDEREEDAAERGPCIIYGMNQAEPVGPANPSLH